MRSCHRSVLSLAAALTVALTAFSVAGWSNGGYSADIEDPDYGTHDWIADMALAMQTEDVSYLMTTYHASFLLGTEAPDNPEFIGDSVKHHVYFYSSGELQDDVGATRASAMYDLALERLVSGEFSVAAYYVGAMTHYIADMGVFGHTMGSGTDWGAEVHHSDYEREFEYMLDSLSLPEDMVLGDMTAYDATIELARDITFGSGQIRPNVWMDVNYDWSDQVFVDSAMASLHRAVSAVAAAINHLIKEAVYEPPPEPPPPTAPLPPASLEAYLDGAEVLLIWSPPSSNGGAPVIEYIVYRGTTSNARAQVATVSSLTLSWRDTGVEEGRGYHYWVTARNSAGQSLLSEVATVTVPVSEDEGASFPWHLAVYAAMAAFASGGAIMWKRSRGGKRE